ncbi:FAD-binding oxidoreductase [Alterisphingorhabdus coralli]|uniref:D-lactate dehydrogenase (cytochrome) n=1 Tax=Alterisphingorhabdus coralli TaxID=3071408 RepID=A0AA97F986_9SPHN|nr:FAD-binding oxidoreductase [Parasphingorhabdus sp. SCSIO 66989]WOE75372.1 FAD-binding oxidoreductase [Parasphingorhabdus sp. SCSIO 66989]
MAVLADHSVLDDIARSGAEVITDAESLEFFAHDIMGRGADLRAVVRPDDKDQLAAAVAAATGQGLAVIPRGGGVSYTGGYTPSQPGAVLFDLGAMDRVLDINETDRTVTVEAGCSWAKLHETLAPLGLRTPYWGTLSGLKATVGGSMSQNAIFWGSGRYGTAAQNCHALEVVLADGSILKTGPQFTRPYGPDLSGIFLADTGALGIKATITMPLIPEAKAHGYASFIFETHQDVLGAVAEIERAGIATECFGFDPGLNAIRMKRDSLSSDAKALGTMMKKQDSVWKALKEGAKVVAAGRDFLDEAKFSLHVLTEGRIQAAADADLEAARTIAMAHGASETDNTIPKIIRANPFGPLNGMLGPEGQRWAPIHGLLPHSKVAGCYEAIEALFAQHREEMDQHGMFTGTLITAVGGAGTIIEPCIYWPDESYGVHAQSMDAAHYAKLPKPDANPAARAVAHRLKQALVDLFHQWGAVHYQIGRTYRYRESLTPEADSLLQSIKQTVDPHGLMNPGALGLER